MVNKKPVSMRKIRFLESCYLAAFGLLAAMVVSVPILVRRGFPMTGRLFIEQDMVEALLLVFLLAVAYALSRRYKAALKSHRLEIRRLGRSNEGLTGRLTDAFKYIGKVNVELQEIRSVAFHLTRLPESRREFKNLLATFARKAMTIVNSDWVMIRIVHRRSLNTLVEHLEVRRGDGGVLPQLGNRVIIGAEAAKDRALVRCGKENHDFVVACVFPRARLSREETLLLETLAAEIELLFVVSMSGPHRDAGETHDGSPATGYRTREV